MSIGKVREFDVRSGVWSSYIDRLNMYFKVNKVTDDLKLPTLIATMGDEAYELLVNLASPSKPSELQYAHVCELLRQHLQPTPSSLAERYRFRQKRQGSGEDIATFVAELKKLSRDCKFKEKLNENLRDQFICGLNSDVIRQRLFAEEDTITFAEAVKLAKSLEAAERDAAIVESTNGAEAMHAMKQNTSSKGWARRGGSYSTPSMRTRAAGERAGSAGAGALAAEPSTSVRQYGEPRASVRQYGEPRASVRQYGEPRASVRQYGKCTACGRTSHSFTVCRFRNFTCSKCHRVGHLRRVCPAENADSAQMSQECTYFGGAEAGEFSDNEYDVIHNSSREEDGNIEEQLNLLALNNYKAI
ncbi:uncharacterized protein LOC119190175 [Manduca sexta]|uniref:uncharacterized protein LOC119190175 n=1 Tax=Manduca sexta TaxID=7130 RepID=UPI00188F985C|nr:uncharacterized protein LOC119190175 [Manduca sexta]